MALAAATLDIGDHRAYVQRYCVDPVSYTHLDVYKRQTISRVEQYFRYGMPLTCKTVTVTGDCIANPGNYRIPLGMSVRDVICLLYTSRCV